MRKIVLGFMALWASQAAKAQQSFAVQEALDYAAQNNLQIKKAALEIKNAKYKVLETRGIALPQVNGKINYNYFLDVPVQVIPAQMFGGPAGQYAAVKFGLPQNASLGLTVSQLLFNGSWLVGMKSAEAYQATTHLIKEKTEISVKEAVMMAYTGVLVSEENIKTLEENKKILQKGLADMKATHKQGLAELQMVEQLEYSNKNLQITIDKLKRNKETVLNLLKFSMGYPQEQSLTLSTSLPEMMNKSQWLDGQHTKDFIENHIDMRLKNNELQLAELKYKYQKSKDLPTVAAFANVSGNAFSNSFTFFNTDQNWYRTSLIGLQIDVPIFTGFQSKYQKEQAKIDIEKVKLEQQFLANQLDIEAKNRKIDYLNAQESLRSAQELIKLSQSIYQKQQIKFKEGMGSSFDLQSAESQLLQAQGQYYQAALELVQSKIKLDKALGK
jgi:outer membrane protein